MTYEQLKCLVQQFQHATAGAKWKRLRDGAVVTLTVSLVDNPMPWFKREGAQKQSSAADWFTFVQKFKPVE